MSVTSDYKIIGSHEWDADSINQHLSKILQARERIAATCVTEINQQEFTDLEWNAQEAINLLSKSKNLPWGLGKLFLPQDKINHCILYSTDKTVQIWEKIIQNKYIRRRIQTKSPDSHSFLVHQAYSRIQQAREKALSLEDGGESLRQFSLRQIRFFQQIASTYSDLGHLASGLFALLQMQNSDSEDLKQLHNDLFWHSNELQTKLGPRNQTWPLGQRIRFPIEEFNRLAGTSALLHSKLLKMTTEIEMFKNE